MPTCSKNFLYAMVPMCGSVIFGSTIVFGSATLNDLKREFYPLSTFQISAFQSLPAILSIFGPYLWNFLLSKFSLRAVTSSVGIFGIFSWLLLLLMSKKLFWFAIIVRGLDGIVLAGVCTVCPLLANLLATEGSHGLFGSVHPVGIAIGYVTFSLIGVCHKWQFQIYGSIVFLLILGCFVWVIPESAIRKSSSTTKSSSNSQNDGASNLNSIPNKTMKDDSIEDELINNDNNTTQQTEQGQTNQNEQIEEVEIEDLNDSIFDKKYRKQLIISMIMMFCAQFSGTGSIIQNTSPLLSEVGLSIDSGYQASIALSAQLIMLLIVSTLMDHFGGQVMWIVSSAGTTLSLLIYALNIKFSWSKWIPMIALFGYQLSFGAGLASVPWYILPEPYPIHLKRTAQSIGTSMNWTSASIMMFLFPFLQKWLGQFGVMTLLMGINILVLLFGIFFVKDKNLEKKKKGNSNGFFNKKNNNNDKINEILVLDGSNEL